MSQALKDAIAASMRINKVLLMSTCSEWQHLDLSMAQLKMLFEIAELGETTVGGIAEKLHAKMPAVSLVVDKLVLANYVERRDDESDRRRIWLTLTGEGEELISRLREGRTQLKEWMQDLAQDEVDCLAKGLMALAKSAEKSSKFDQIGKN